MSRNNGRDNYCDFENFRTMNLDTDLSDVYDILLLILNIIMCQISRKADLYVLTNSDRTNERHILTYLCCT